MVHYATNPPEIGRRRSTRSDETIAFISLNIWIIDFLSKKFEKNDKRYIIRSCQ